MKHTYEFRQKNLELYENLKKNISLLDKKEEFRRDFINFWRTNCIMNFKLINARNTDTETNREFVKRNKKQLKKLRKEVIENYEYYVKKCLDVMEKKNHFRVFHIKTKEEARTIFLNEINDKTILYNSNSDDALDMRILNDIKKKKIQIIETHDRNILLDLLDDQLPSSGINPMNYIKKEEITKHIKMKYGDNVYPQKDAILTYFKEKFNKKNHKGPSILLTSATAIVADGGVIFISETEENVNLLPKDIGLDKLICVVGINKIVPTIKDAFLILEIQERIYNTSFLNIHMIPSTSQNITIPDQNVSKINNVKEVIVIFVDDWQTKTVKEKLFYKSYLRCIDCKGCTYVCTASKAFGNSFGSQCGVGAPMILKDYICNGIEAAVKDGLFLCTGCENCHRWCPVGADFSKIMKSLKKEATLKGLCPPLLEKYKNNILNNQNPFKDDTC